MKTKIKSLVVLLLSALSGFVNQNEKRRVTVGLTLSVGSLFYMLFAIDMTGNNTPGSFLLYFFTSGLLGLL